jgi:hypothetical protein
VLKCRAKRLILDFYNIWNRSIAQHRFRLVLAIATLNAQNQIAKLNKSSNLTLDAKIARKNKRWIGSTRFTLGQSASLAEKQHLKLRECKIDVEKSMLS